MLKQYVKKYKNLPVQVKASIWFLISSFLQKSISALTTPIFTRLLSSAEFGQFNVFLSWQSILRVIITLNLFYGVYTAGLVKFEERRSEFVSSLEGLTLTLVCTWGLIYICLKDIINDLLSLNTPQMLSMIITFWTTAVFSFWAAEQRVNYKYKTLVIITLGVSLAKPIAGIISVLVFPDKVTARIISLAVIELACFTWMFFSHIKRCPALFSSFFWKYALRFNIPLIPHYLAQNILNNSDRIMIKRMVSDNAAGIYSLAYSVALIMNLFNTALTQTMGPWVYERIKQRKEEEIKTVAIPSIAIIACVNLLLIAFAPEIIRIFAPPSYYEAIWTIPPVVMSVYFTYLYNVFSYFEFYYEKTTFIAIATMLSALANVILNYAFIGLFGYIAAGYTTLICFILYAVGHFLVMQKISQKYMNGKQLFPIKDLIFITISFMAVGFIFCALYPYPKVRYCALIALFAGLLLNKKFFKNSINQLLNIRKKGEQ